MDIAKLDNVYYINLDHRVDRKIHIEKQLNIFGWNYTRFSAIKHEIGAIGCSMSHLRLLELAKEKNLEYIVILEDDITFTNIPLFQQQLVKLLTSDIKYDIILFGGNSYPPHQIISEFCMRTFNCQTTVGYYIPKHFYDILIENFRESIANLTQYKSSKLYACDIYWKKLQQKYTFVFITPATVTQIPCDYSDIIHRNTNYNDKMLDISENKKKKR